MNSRSLAEQGEKIIGSVTGTVRTVTGKTPLTGRPLPEAPAKARTPSADQAAAARKAPGAFRTISEVAEDLNVQQHVLRFWETKFSQIRPLKRGGGRRYYRPEDLLLLRRIHHLLYTEGYTIKGVQKLLREKGRAGILQDGASALPPAGSSAPLPKGGHGQSPVPAQDRGVPPGDQAPARPGMSAEQKSLLQAMLGELREIRSLVKPR